MSSSVNECECTGPGWCERHSVRKSAHWVELCRTRPDYFAAWENGVGLGQFEATAGPHVATATPGPGTELRKLLGCGCGCWFTRRMNKWGVDKCRLHMDTITGWLVQDAIKRRQCMRPAAAARLVVLAIERAEAKEAGAGSGSIA